MENSKSLVNMKEWRRGANFCFGKEGIFRNREE